MKTISLLLLALSLSVCQATAAGNDPPQVGDTPVQYLKTNVTGQTWTVTGYKDGAAFDSISSVVTVTEKDAVGSGYIYEASVGPLTANHVGDLLIVYTPDTGTPVTNTMTVVAASTAVTSTVFNGWTGAHSTQFAHLDADISSVAASGDSLNILPFQGSVSYEGPEATASVINVTQGDTPTIEYAITSGGTAYDLSGYTVQFGAKASKSNSSYVMAVRDITSDVDSPATAGTGQFTLTTSDTSTIGKRYGEIQITSGAIRMTPWKCIINVESDVVR